MRIKHSNHSGHLGYCRRWKQQLNVGVSTLMFYLCITAQLLSVSGFELPGKSHHVNGRAFRVADNHRNIRSSRFPLHPKNNNWRIFMKHDMPSNNSCNKDESYITEHQRRIGEQKKNSTLSNPGIKSFANHQRSTQTILASTLLGLALIFSPALSPPANAGFGPSGGATTSPPPNLITPSIEDKSAKKLKQLIGATLSDNRLEQFSIQLNDLTEALQNLLNSDDSETSGEEGGTDEVSAEVKESKVLKKEEREAELQRLRIFQQQIADQESMLGKLEKQPYWFNYLAAFIGSVASTLVMHPVDTIKTRLQVKSGTSSEDDNDGGESEDGVGSITSLYEGLAGNILKEGPASALYLGVYESVKYALLPTQLGAQSVLFVYLASGAAGEMCGSVIRAPAEAIKSTVQSGLSGSTAEAAMQVFGTSETRKNVVRAWSASIWRDVPFGAIQLAIFELTKTYILNNSDIDFDSSTLLAEAVIGAFAGGWGALLTNPFDIITTRIITQSIDDGNKPLGVIEMAQKLYEEGGMGAFLVGWQARVGYWAPAISIFLTCYCSVRQAGVQQGWF